MGRSWEDPLYNTAHNGEWNIIKLTSKSINLVGLSPSCVSQQILLEIHCKKSVDNSKPGIPHHEAQSITWRSE